MHVAENVCLQPHDVNERGVCDLSLSEHSVSGYLAIQVILGSWSHVLVSLCNADVLTSSHAFPDRGDSLYVEKSNLQCAKKWCPI